MKCKVFLLVTLFVATIIPAASATFVVMEKSHTPIQIMYSPGTTIEFIITLEVLQDEGGSALTIENLKITDTLPSGLTYVKDSEYSTPGGASVNFVNTSGILEWDFGAGPFSTTPQATVSFEVTVDINAPRGVFLSNSAEAMYTEVGTQVTSSPSVSDNIKISNPCIELVKEVSTSSVYEPADITYTYTVTNIGDCNLHDVIVYDQTLGLQILGPINLDMGFSASEQHVLLNMYAGTYENTAIATGYDEADFEVTDTDSAICTIKKEMIGGYVTQAISDQNKINITLSIICLVILGGYYQIKKPF